MQTFKKTIVVLNLVMAGAMFDRTSVRYLEHNNTLLFWVDMFMSFMLLFLGILLFDKILDEARSK